MLRVSCTFGIGLCVAMIVPSLADAQSAKQIIDTMADRNATGFQSGESTTTVTLALKNGKTRVWTIKARGVKKGAATWSRLTFLDPPADRGVELLMLDSGHGAQQYLYLPKTGRSRPIAGAQKNASFMGTDFTYGDLESKDARKGTPTRLADEGCGGGTCFRVDVAASDTQSPYGLVRLWIAQRTYLPMKVEYYEGATLAKTLAGDDVQTAEGRTYLRSFHMDNHKRGSRTTVVVTSLDGRARFPDAIFDKENLGK